MADFFLRNCCLFLALTLLCSEDNVPSLIVCNLGKGRTGVLSAIIEGLCEVPEDTIAHDYSLSKLCLSICLTSLTRAKPKEFPA